MGDVVTKACNKCGEEKPVADFDWRKETPLKGGYYAAQCKECRRELGKARYAADPGLWKARAKRRRENEPGKVAAEKRRWKQANRAHCNAKNREWAALNPEKKAARSRRWQQANKAAVNAKSRRWHRANPDYWRDPMRRLANSVRTAMWKALNGGKRGRRWETLVGYTLADLKAHLESRFKPGMTLDNYGEWEIDHIRPVASFAAAAVGTAEFDECWCLSNLQPLWRADNRRKSGKWDGQTRLAM